ncbi:methylmalonyl-CoA mutase family protein (plasmid) [Azospirillum sp. A26]|uniref:methylmalonyl-CoA mutase family protein n=1 Tax=Azospirillum sp. A26 TaxID=3160607 RepID=UPI00366BA069
MDDRRDDAETIFAAEFPPATREQWRALVERGLKGAAFEKRLVTRLYEGIAVQPLYTVEDWAAAGDPSGFPGFAPFTRGGHAGGAGPDGWDILTEHDIPDPKAANAAILTDLLRGATAIRLRFDQLDRPGIAIDRLDDLDRALADVYPEMVPLSLDAGADAVAAAVLLTALWRRRSVSPDKARGAFNADPIGTLAATGALPGSLEAALAGTAALAAWTAGSFPQVTAVGVDSSPWHDAGATESQDLAAAMATGVAYLRALTAAGMDIDTAFQQIAFTLSVGCDQFLSIAKLRAARRLWGRIGEASGASEAARAMHLTARTARRIMARRDPWVNMLRTTVAGFAAGVGGADAVAVLPFDAALGAPDEFARRIARNSQILLKEESSLARVADPAGGSWYVETLTEQLAQAAWAEFQDIERRGGIAVVLADGSLARAIAESWAQREANIARRKDPLTGVSEFPNIFEQPVVRPVPVIRERTVTPHTPAVIGSGSLDDLVEAAAGGTTRAGLTAALARGAPARVEPLPRHRLHENFDSLRDAADRHKMASGSWPAIFLANIGPVAQHTARATYAKNFFEAGGVQALGNSGFADAEAVAAAFRASGARIAVLCGSDALYEAHAAPFAHALKAAGAEYLFLAGNPGDRRGDYVAAGIDEFVSVGCDVLSVLRATLARLGVPL